MPGLGGSAPRGVCLVQGGLLPGGVPGPGVVPLGGSAPRGGVPGPGGLLPGGVPGPAWSGGVCSGVGWYPSMH